MTNYLVKYEGVVEFGRDMGYPETKTLYRTEENLFNGLKGLKNVQIFELKPVGERKLKELRKQYDEIQENKKKEELAAEIAKKEAELEALKQKM